MNYSHGFEVDMYVCPNCGAEWEGEAAGIGYTGHKRETCPECEQPDVRPDGTCPYPGKYLA